MANAAMMEETSSDFDSKRYQSPRSSTGKFSVVWSVGAAVGMGVKIAARPR